MSTADSLLSSAPEEMLVVLSLQAAAVGPPNFASRGGALTEVGLAETSGRVAPWVPAVVRGEWKARGPHSRRPSGKGGARFHNLGYYRVAGRTVSRAPLYFRWTPAHRAVAGAAT